MWLTKIDGNRITTVLAVKRQENHSSQFMKSCHAWNEDISKCENFDDLPEAAKNYVKVMAKSICEVAYGEELKEMSCRIYSSSELGLILDK